MPADKLRALPSGLVAIALGGAACGAGAAPRPEAAPAVAAAAAPNVEAAPILETAEARELPTSCADGPICSLPADFAERLCAGAYPEVALRLFAPATPWKRAYLQRSFKAWHVGGRGELRELRAGEEVLIARTNRGTEGNDDLGGRAFDVLRWDGTCVSLMEDEISFRKPPSASVANIAWKKLEPAYQSAFFEDRYLENLRLSQTRLCDAAGVEKEPAKSKCELATRQLSLAMAQSVGKGKELPAPASIP